MGFSTSGATAIIFVGLLIAVGMAYPAVQTAHDQRQTAIEDRDDRALDVRNTAIDLTAASYDDGDGTLTVNATNTGSTSLSVAETDLLIDGLYEEPAGWLEQSVDDGDDRELWQPGETLSIVASPDGEPERVKVVTEHGVADAGTVADGTDADGEVA